MKITIPLPVLRAAVQVPKSALASRVVMPELKNFLIEADSGQVRITASNMLLFAATSVAAITDESWSFLAPGEWLHELLANASGEGDVILEQVGTQVQVSINRGKYRTGMVPVGEYPSVPTMNDARSGSAMSIRTQPAMLAEALAYAVLGNDRQGTIACTSVALALLPSSDGPVVSAIGTNGHRVCSGRLAASQSAGELDSVCERLIARDDAEVLSRILNDKQFANTMVALSINDNRLFLQMQSPDSEVVVSVGLMGEKPPTSRAIIEKNLGVLVGTCDRVEFLSALKRLSVVEKLGGIGENIGISVDFEMQDNELHLRVVSADGGVGDGSEVINAIRGDESDALVGRFALSYLQHGAQAMRGDNVQWFGFPPKGGAIKMRDDSGIEKIMFCSGRSVK